MNAESLAASGYVTWPLLACHLSDARMWSLAPAGGASFLPAKFVAVAKNLTFPLYHMKPTFPMPSGGISPTMVPQVMKDLGPEIVIGTGGGIHAHPRGPVAGARAFRQAIDATMQGIPLEQAAAEHEALRIALEEWVDPFKGLEM